MGFIHDFGSLIISLHNKGHSIGNLAADIISNRVRTLLLLIIFFSLWIVVAIFVLIIALLLDMYPQAVLPIWLEIPIAIYLGHLIYSKKKELYTC